MAEPGQIPADLFDRVRTIELRASRLVENLFLGEYHAVFRGRGIEFDELRPYVPGDDVRAIDWNSFARFGEPMIRRYREDRDLTVLFAVDVSASSRTGALPLTKAEVAAEVCAVLALAALRNKDRVGLLLFASEPERYVRPAGGTGHILRVVREILWNTPRTRGTDIAAALRYVTGLQKRRATLFLVSDFLTGGFEGDLRAATRRFDIVAIRVREPVDSDLPNAGIVTLRDPETGQATEVDTASRRVREAYHDRVTRLDEDRALAFGELGIDEIAITVGEEYVPALLAFFRRRARAAVS